MPNGLSVHRDPQRVSSIVQKMLKFPAVIFWMKMRTCVNRHECMRCSLVCQAGSAFLEATCLLTAAGGAPLFTGHDSSFDRTNLDIPKLLSYAHVEAESQFSLVFAAL